MRDSSGNEVAGNCAISVGPAAITFGPGSDLKYNTRYYVTIDTTLRDLCWNRLATPYTWSFRTELDTVKPRVVSVTPAAGDTNVTVNTTITVRFSEPMDKTTAQGSLSLIPPVAFSGFAWQGDTLMTAALAETLSFSRQYQVTISTGAQDLAGNGLATADTLSFKTVRGIYASCSIAGEVRMFQQSDMKPEGKLVSYSNARQIKFSADGNKAYLLCGGNPGQLHFLDVKNGNSNQGYLTVGNTPYDVAVSPYGNKLAVSITGDDRVLIINTETMGVIDTIPTGDAPTGIAFTPFNEIYVTLSQDTRVERYDIFTHAMDWVAIITGGEESLFSAANGRLFVTNGPYVTVITGATFAALYNINNVSSRPFGLAVSPDGAHLAVSCYQEGVVKIYNAVSASEPAPTAQITVGTNPKGLCYSPDGTKLYVSNSGSSSISVISRNVNNSYTLSSTVTTGSGPWGIAVTP
jgi:YVTN family beta-propeller protein